MSGTPRRIVEVVDADEAAVIERYRSLGIYVCDGCLVAGAGRVPAAGLCTVDYGGPEVERDFGVAAIGVCLSACADCLARLEAGEPAATERFDELAACVAARAYAESIPGRN